MIIRDKKESTKIYRRRRVGMYIPFMRCASRETSSVQHPKRQNKNKRQPYGTRKKKEFISFERPLYYATFWQQNFLTDPKVTLPPFSEPGDATGVAREQKEVY